jgi:hypothetical protein
LGSGEKALILRKFKLVILVYSVGLFRYASRFFRGIEQGEFSASRMGYE